MYASLLGDIPSAPPLLPYRQIADERHVGGDMLIAAVAGVPHQNGHFPSRCRSFAIVLREGSIRVGKSAVRPAPLDAFWQKSSNRRGGKYTADSLLRQAT